MRKKKYKNSHFYPALPPLLVLYFRCLRSIKKNNYTATHKNKNVVYLRIDQAV